MEEGAARSLDAAAVSGLPAEAAKAVEFAAAPLSFSERNVEMMSVAALGVLLAVGCRAEADVWALSAEAVVASFSGNTSFVSEEQLLAAMTEEQRVSQTKLQARLAELQNSKTELEEASKSAQDPWRGLAQAMFNLKEFSYLR